jgi:hypothetical protein
VKHAAFIGLAAFALAAGCSSNADTKWPELHPAKGVVTQGGQPVSGGFVHFRGDDAALADFNVSSDVNADGTFTLSTSHSQDKKGTRKPGAPAGKYIVTYSPAQGDQSAGKVTLPTQLNQPTTIAAGENNLTVNLGSKK